MRSRRAALRFSAALGLSLAAAPAFAGDDDPIVVAPTGPAPAHFHSGRRPGPIKRAFHKVGSAVHKHFIGDPEEFLEPPLGFYLYENIGLMKSHADQHSFTLYNSDFVVGADRLTLAGTKRLNDMARKLPKWMGPMLIEWTPEDPALGEARKKKIAAILDSANIAMVAERIVVTPSPYAGLYGTDAGNNYTILINRDINAGRGFSVSPTTTATFSGGGQR